MRIQAKRIKFAQFLVSGAKNHFIFGRVQQKKGLLMVTQHADNQLATNSHTFQSLASKVSYSAAYLPSDVIRLIKLVLLLCGHSPSACLNV